jgi:hypothetical protein
MTMRGTAHGSVLAGSKVNPVGGRDPEAVPEAAAAMFESA